MNSEKKISFDEEIQQNCDSLKEFAKPKFNETKQKRKENSNTKVDEVKKNQKESWWYFCIFFSRNKLQMKGREEEKSDKFFGVNDWC